MCTMCTRPTELQKGTHFDSVHIYLDMCTRSAPTCAQAAPTSKRYSWTSAASSRQGNSRAVSFCLLQLGYNLYKFRHRAPWRGGPVAAVPAGRGYQEKPMTERERISLEKQIGVE